MGEPETVADVMELIFAANWVQDKIPNFASSAGVLQDFCTRALAGSKRHTKAVAKRIPVAEAGWDDNCKSALDGLRKAIIRAVTVTHYDPEKVICCFTDASRYFWSICITQIPKEDVDKTFEEM